jgi:acyl-coenzyme A synthetase/AMP-(fatty) acid ligase
MGEDMRDPTLDQYRSTCQWLAHYARERPVAVAFTNADTYHALALNVVRFMDALTAAGVENGQTIGVETTDRYLHLLILLAAEALSVATISLVPSELGPPANLGRFCDWILVSQPVVSPEPAKIIVLTLDWITEALTRPMDDQRLDSLERPSAPGTVVRLIKSSGTTGVPKVMAITQRVQQLRIERYQLHVVPRIKQRLDYLCLYHFTVSGSHVRALLTLQLGGTIHLIGGGALWDMILAGTGNYLMFVAGDLPPFVRSAPVGHGRFDLHIDANGSAISPQLRQEVREKITNNLTVVYGSNECGRIAFVDDANVGALVPDVHVKILDDRGEPVPLGHRGLICIKTDTMTDCYVGAPELTRAVFIDGWHHTNDIGFQPSEGRLVLLGRADDMLNIGGIKIAPGPIEERLKAIDGVRDALVTSIDDNLETTLLLVAVEAEPDGDPADIEQRLTPIIEEYADGFKLMVLSVFPRTETGKIRREDVKELYRRVESSRSRHGSA